jgi:hypothetical protein
MYSIEYKCTNDETPQTTISITVDKGSKQKLQFTTKSSDINQGERNTSQLLPKITVS